MSQMEFENEGNDEDYKIEVIHNNGVYANKSESYIPGLYYLVS